MESKISSTVTEEWVALERFPDERHVREMLQALGLDMTVEHGSSAAVSAVLDGRRGRVELR